MTHAQKKKSTKVHVLMACNDYESSTALVAYRNEIDANKERDWLEEHRRREPRLEAASCDATDEELESWASEEAKWRAELTERFPNTYPHDSYYVIELEVRP